MHRLLISSVRSLVALIFIFSTLTQALAQSPATGWTWVAGTQPESIAPRRGTPGVASPENSPGYRDGAITWIDAAGNLWLFGGFSIAPENEMDSELYNDLWKYDRSSKLWTWMSGQDSAPRISIYGTPGTESDSVAPGSRQSSAVWVGADGMFYMFGGIGYDATGPSGKLSDLWRYNPTTNRWAFMGGSTTAGQQGDYGTLGTANAANLPGGRSGAACWVDGDGVFWLLGGEGRAQSVSVGSLNDLWKYEPLGGMWTWMGGESDVDPEPQPGTQGVSSPSNWPGGLSESILWKDGSGNIWLHGGYGELPDYWGSGHTSGWSNDLWKRDTNGHWTWVKGDNLADMETLYGTKGVASDENMPGGRSNGAGWLDATGNLWRYGGTGIPASWDIISTEETWKYNIGNDQWTWMRGENTNDSPPIYGARDEFHADHYPGLRSGFVWWYDASAGRAWVYGGDVQHPNGETARGADFWELNIATDEWAWIGGPRVSAQPGVYNTMGAPHPNNLPGARSGAVTWLTPDNEMWMFGGYGYDKDARLGHLNDLWKYNRATGQWTWMKGNDTVDSTGRYGTVTVPHALNVPPARTHAVSWVDNVGNLWLFGGDSTRELPAGYDVIERNDLWKFDRGTGNWTWMKGGRFNVDDGVYGEKGVAGDANTPGSRQGAVAWTDNGGNFWLFGGYGAATQNRQRGRLSDLWMYTPQENQWTWIHGPNVYGQTGTYSASGVFAPANTPGGRENANSWVDGAGDLWLFGGEGYTTQYQDVNNELWKFDIVARQWAFINGKSDGEERGEYGVMGVPAEGNRPSSRLQSLTWTGADGKLWMYGGEGLASDSNFEWPLSDLWCYDPENDLWTWMAGSSVHNELPAFGVQNELHPDNTPGARFNAAGWADDEGFFWLYSGESHHNSPHNGLWKYGTGVVVTAAQDWQLYQ